MMAPAAIAMIIYTIGIPALFAILLFKNKDKVSLSCCIVQEICISAILRRYRSRTIWCVKEICEVMRFQRKRILISDIDLQTSIMI